MTKKRARHDENGSAKQQAYKARKIEANDRRRAEARALSENAAICRAMQPISKASADVALVVVAAARGGVEAEEVRGGVEAEEVRDEIRRARNKRKAARRAAR